jgi:hypothetical protein
LERRADFLGLVIGEPDQRHLFAFHLLQNRMRDRVSAASFGAVAS